MRTVLRLHWLQPPVEQHVSHLLFHLYPAVGWSGGSLSKWFNFWTCSCTVTSNLLNIGVSTAVLRIWPFWSSLQQFLRPQHGAFDCAFLCHDGILTINGHINVLGNVQIVYELLNFSQGLSHSEFQIRSTHSLNYKLNATKKHSSTMAFSKPKAQINIYFWL